MKIIVSQTEMQGLHLCAHAVVSFTPLKAVTGLAEKFSKGATIRRLSDMLSFSSHCGSTESSRHLYDAPFFLSPFSMSPPFSFPSYLVPVHCIEIVFFSPFLSPTSFQTSIKVFICNAKNSHYWYLKKSRHCKIPTLKVCSLNFFPLCESMFPSWAFVWGLFEVLLWSVEQLKSSSSESSPPLITFTFGCLKWLLMNETILCMVRYECISQGYRNITTAMMVKSAFAY